jgi:MFS family permease
MFLMPVFGNLSDRHGRKKLLVIGLGSCSLASFAYLLGDSVPALVVVRLIHGAAAAMVVPLVSAYVGDIAPRGEEGRWMGYLNTIMTVGMGLGPLLGGAISDFAGPRMVFVAMGGLYLLGCGGISLFLPESHTGTGRKAKGPSLKKLGTSRMFWGLLIFWLAVEMSFSIVMAFLPIDSAVRMGLTSLEIGLLIAINTAVMAVGLIFTGRLSDKLDRRWLATAGSLLHYAAMACIVISENFWHLGLIMAVSGAGFALASPAVSALTIEEGRRQGMGTTNAWISVGMSGGVAAGPVFAGSINDTFGMPAVFISAGAIGLPAATLTFWLLRNKKTDPVKTLQAIS